MMNAIEIAEQAAHDYKCKVIVPQFPEGAIGTDWNDLHRSVGLEEVKRQINDYVLDSWPPPIRLKETSNPFTDAANAQRFVRQYARDTLNIDGIGWHRWDGSRWIHMVVAQTAKIPFLVE